ncbi:MAG: CDP-diacylglycerol--glycerol-3-phosphate 3-phosphatidyltransferase [Acidimicrobiaceae bacterium]|nr:CDP-diacylglycerol--glycerol-3-phosphate 3-phosphatidyltransferase [Acidimicrobiaceae bacterium]
MAVDLTRHLGTVVSPANLVTLLRLLLSPVLFAMVLAAEDRGGVSWGAFLLGLVLAASDLVDGVLARRRGTVSRWGAFLDPFADKVVVIGVAVCLVMVDRYAWLPVALLAVREGVITLYRLWFVRRGLAVPARRSAKWKTTVQGAALLIAVLPPIEDADWLVTSSLWVAVAFTLATGAQYLADGSRATSTTGA